MRDLVKLGVYNDSYTSETASIIWPWNHNSELEVRVETLCFLVQHLTSQPVLCTETGKLHISSHLMGRRTFVPRQYKHQCARL